jgi:hypothetical protein
MLFRFRPPIDWRKYIWLVILFFFVTWMWQEGLRQVNVKNIPYGEFKHFLAEGKVAECSVGETEIVGRIDPARHLAGNSESATAPQTGLSAASPASEKNQKPPSAKPSTKPYLPEGQPRRQRITPNRRAVHTLAYPNETERDISFVWIPKTTISLCSAAATRFRPPLIAGRKG